MNPSAALFYLLTCASFKNVFVFIEVWLIYRLPRWRAGKELACNAGEDAGLIPRSGGSPGGGHGDPLQYSCLENRMDRGAWPAIVHGVIKESDTT